MKLDPADYAPEKWTVDGVKTRATARIRWRVQEVMGAEQ